jgi:hypothetical protein
MLFSGAQFRALLRNPDRYVAMARKPPVPQEGGSPQRPLLEAGLKAYFKSGRAPTVALEDLERRVAKSSSESREANAGAVRRMLRRFLALDASEGTPAGFFPGRSVAPIGKHLVGLSPSLWYRLGDGYLVRQLWTESDFSLARPYTRLAAAGYLVHSEALLGAGCVHQVEFWHLRSGSVAGWQASDLRRLIPSLIAVLDSVANGLGKA